MRFLNLSIGELIRERTVSDVPWHARHLGLLGPGRGHPVYGPNLGGTLPSPRGQYPHLLLTLSSRGRGRAFPAGISERDSDRTTLGAALLSNQCTCSLRRHRLVADNWTVGAGRHLAGVYWGSCGNSKGSEGYGSRGVLCGRSEGESACVCMCVHVCVKGEECGGKSI